ncbi:MAG: translocation/assembly module TamB domain-containing protein, partial [Woeseiaceae bacterium]
MIWRGIRWGGAIILSILLLAVVVMAWLIATQGGARWLLAQASPRLPEPLSIESVSGSLWHGLEFRNFAWKDESAIVSVADVAAELELRPLLKREVRINTLAIRNVEVVVSERAQPDTESAPLNVDIPIALHLDAASIENARITISGKEIAIDTVQLGGRLSGSTLKIQRFALRSSEADIDLSGSAELAGNFPLSASATWKLRLPEQTALSGALQVSGDAASYEIEHRLDAPYAVSTDGVVAISDGNVILDLVNRWERIHLQQADAAAIELADGRLSVTGGLNSLDFDGLTTLSSDEVPATTLQTQGTYTGDRVDVAALLAANDWGTLRASGAVLLSAEPSWSFDISLSELNPALADARLQGALELTGATSGQLVNGKPTLDLQVERLSGVLNNYAVSGSGAFLYADDALRFDNLIVSVGDNRLSVGGVYGRGLTLDAKARFADLGQLDLGVGGALNSDLSIESDLKSVEASGFVTADGLSWAGNTIDSLNATFQLPSSGNGSVSIEVDSIQHGSLAAGLGGRFADNRWRGTLNSLNLRRDWLGEWSLQQQTPLTVSRTQLELETACFGTTEIEGLACVALNYDFAGPVSFETTISALPVASLPRYLPEGASILGEISLQARGNFADGRLNATTDLRVEGLGLLASYEGDDVSADFEEASVSAEVIDNRLVGNFALRLADSDDHVSGNMEVQDILDFRSPLSGQGSLALNDLSLVSFFYPDIANAKGAIYGRIDAAGSLAAPEVSGEVGLRDGSVDVRRAGISVTDIGLLVRQSKAGELSLQGSARSGEGYLQIDGATSIGAETGIRSEVRLKGEDFQLMRLPDLQAAASPNITVVFDERQTRVSGELVIPEASITVKNLPETTEKPSPDAVVHRGEVATVQPRRMLYVDVRTALGDDVSFSGFGLSTKLGGSVRITGSSRSPYQGQGRVVLSEGRYQAYGQNLEIESGELIFNGPLSNPTLNVRATRTASDNTVAGIHLTGTPAQLKSQVYSEPPLGDAEALSYLLTGRPLASASSEQGDMLNQAAFALGLTTAGSVASRIRNQLGLETFGIQGAGENRQLVAGKRLG